jgi:hypothetical protein
MDEIVAVVEGLPLVDQEVAEGRLDPGAAAREQWEDAMFREIFPTPTLEGAVACAALSLLKFKPRTVLGVVGALAGGAMLFGALRCGELARWVIRLELSQLRELQRQKVVFVDDVVAALDNGGVPSVPEELQPLRGQPDGDDTFKYVYRAPGCTPLWFRCSAVEGAPAHDWQWSPDLRIWIDVDSMVVPTGEWEGQEPARSNQILINRLRTLRCLAGQLARAPPHAPPPLSLPDPDSLPTGDDDVPPAFLCPISYSLMLDPVVSPSGVTYDRASIAAWLQYNDTEPATNRRLQLGDLYPNLALRAQIEAWAFAATAPGNGS